MKNLITNKYLRNELKDLGIHQSSNFSWMKTANMTIDVYKEIGSLNT
jgi:hypothetical protein